MVKDIIPYDYARRVKNEVRGIEADPAVCKRNKELIKAFARDCFAEGLSQARVSKYLNLMKQIAHRVEKPFPQVQVDDIKTLLQEVGLSDMSPWSKRDFRIGIKKFWKWLKGTEEPPKIVRWVKTTMDHSKQKLPQDLLSEKDIERMLECAGNPRDRALIAVLWETGCRAGELLSLRIRSFKNEGEICFLDVSGKTGSRRIPIVAAVPHLTRWLSFHPAKDDPESPMWTSTRKGRGITHLMYGPFCYLLNKVGEQAGIRKRVHPHLFRHSRATFLANKLTEAQMKHFFGWTQGSEMASTYVHLSGRDIQDSILQLYGKTPSKNTQQPRITVAKCGRCGYENPHDSRFCGRCGGPASSGEAVGLSQKLQAYDKLLTALLSDRAVVHALDRKLGSDSELAGSVKELMRILQSS